MKTETKKRAIPPGSQFYDDGTDTGTYAGTESSEGDERFDGMDGLATGLALIATIGMAGALFFSNHFGGAIFYFAFAGGLLGFLKYNYNPASVFLGDSGSMYLGFVVSTLPLCSQTPDSFLVSVGMPLLAMGVPIFDTALAIFRRSVRHLLRKEGAGEETGNDKVMTADTDHLHHRILRSTGLNQRRAAWILYTMAACLVLTGLVGLALKSRAGGLYLAAFAVAAVVIFRDVARIELFDAGKLLAKLAHSRNVVTRRRWARLGVPAMLVFDISLLALAFFATCWLLKIPFSVRMLRSTLPIRVISTFGALVFFRAYMTIWPRAVLSNYFRLLLACTGGAIVGSVGVYYLPSVPASQMKAFTILYTAIPFALLLSVRVIRQFVRDMMYTLDSRRLIQRKDVTRVLVYGAGLRYCALRRELVRKSGGDNEPSNRRVIVGLLDDDLLLRGHYIGGIKIMGALVEAPELIVEHNIGEVIVACEMKAEWLEVVKETLLPTGVKITQFTFTENEIR